LGAVKTTRALTDPVIVHEPTKDWALPSDHQIYQDTKMARLAQNLETPLDERIEYATWPETLAYLSTASMDARYSNREFKETYQYTFREYLDRWTSLDPDQQPPPLNEDPDLDDYRLERLETLRFGIKKDRDKHFVENRYDEVGVESVPKKFWLSEYEIGSENDEIDGYSQSAIDEFSE
jgi:hypothetical protein